MKVPIYVFGVLVAIFKVNAQFIDEFHEMVIMCFDQTSLEEGPNVSLAKNKESTTNDLRDWIFLNNNAGKLRDISWHNRRFTCFHACMMKNRGELEDGKVNLEKYIENLAEEYKELQLDDQSKMHINECVLLANSMGDECRVAAIMGECITDNWQLIELGRRRHL